LPIDFTPTDEQALVVETVRQFAANEIRPRARAAEEAKELPDELLARAHELGLVANALPAAHGGGGERSAVLGVLVAEELAWGDLASALAILSPALLAFPVAEHGSEAQQREWLPRFAGERFVPGALALLEPGFGADPFRPRTQAKRDGAGYVLDGKKCMVPWLPGGDAVLVFADEDGAPQGFLIPRDAAGLTATPEAWMGISALPTVELSLAGVRAPAEARLGGAAGSDLAALIARGRVALAALGVGVARAAFEVARDYAKEREAFGTKIAQKQAIAFLLAQMAIEIDGARLLAWEAAWRLDQELPALREAALAIDQVRRIALDVADGAVQVLGGHGYIRDYLPELHLRNARGFASFEALALV
jgi:alkylation response protein AidB-like acyl-CoA dehydrogenase